LKAIHRSNLDALQATEPSTVGRTLDEARQDLALAPSLGLSR